MTKDIDLSETLLMQEKYLRTFSKLNEMEGSTVKESVQLQIQIFVVKNFHLCGIRCRIRIF